MDPNQNDQANPIPAVPSDDGAAGQDPMATPQPEPTPQPVGMPEPDPTPTPAPADGVGQGQMDEITPPPPMMEDHPQDGLPTGADQGSTGDTNPVV